MNHEILDVRKFNEKVIREELNRSNVFNPEAVDIIVRSRAFMNALYRSDFRIVIVIFQLFHFASVFPPNKVIPKWTFQR